MPLSEADEWRLADSIKFEKSVKVVGAPNEWAALLGASGLTIKNYGLGWNLQVPRAIIDEFGLEQVVAIVEGLHVRYMIEVLELNNINSM